MNQVVVSIYVPTYNHEEYITRALDSIKMQKTRYAYEVFVGEDCSTDNTRQVLQTWERENPDPRFHIFYRDTNMYSIGASNALDLKKRCQGKYLICLEGDDFWTDENKLESQVTFLEEHPEYYAVAHNCTVVGADSLPNGENYPECKDPDYTFRHFASDILPGQYATLLSRNYMTDPKIEDTLLTRKGGAGDRRVYFTLLCYGKIHCIQKPMSAYRHISSGGSSFSANHRYNYDSQESDLRAYMEYAYRKNCREAILVAEFLYLRNIRFARRKGFVDNSRANTDMKNIRHLMRAKFLLLKRDINYRILHKKIHL